MSAESNHPFLERGRTSARLEWAGALLLVLAGLLPRVRDLCGPFDRSFEGFQASFFALGAIDYERLGFGAVGGYPVVNVDLDPARPETWNEYANHPPLVPWLAWAGMATLAPSGWSEAWREARPPHGVELPVRLPFLLFHVAGLVAFFWALRQGVGAREALLGLALLVVLPISAAYAHLVNYENPSLAFVCLGAGFAVRWMRNARGRDLAAFGACIAAAAAVTYAPVFFVPPLAVQAWRRRGFGAALRLGAVGLGAAAVPLGLHFVAARAALRSIGAETAPFESRALLLLLPLLDGSVPIVTWLAGNAERIAHYASLPLALLGAVGLLLAPLPRRAVSASAGSDAIRLGPPLAVGGALLLLAFYRHTAEDQTPFLLNLAPALAALGAAALEAAAPALARLRGGLAPLVVLTSALSLPAVLRTNELRREWRAPGAHGGPAGAEVADGPESELPDRIGRQIAEVLPAGTLGLYPHSLGLTPAAGFYAWRSLWPVDSSASGLEAVSGARANVPCSGFGLTEAYLIVPLVPPASAADSVAGLRERARASRPPDRETANWQAWRLAP